MRSFLRARAPSPSPPTSPLRERSWSGDALSMRFDASLAGSVIAIDLDGEFFASTRADAEGCARFDFSLSPSGTSSASVRPRRDRGGEALADKPLAIAFGRAGSAVSESARTLEPIGRIVSDVDCAALDVAIVIPVYDAPVLVERCIESVLLHTTGRARLIVIDDASPDPAIAPLLARYASREGVTLLRNEKNRGFTATANRGIAEAGRADVVLLNADTEVGPNWLTGLRRAVASRADVATVTAVSDNAGAFSVPELERENPWPSRWTFEHAARALWHDAGTLYPELPTGNGFCMYIRRAVVDEVGGLDEAAFPHGYGEENDFCQRASAKGYRHLIAGNVYVRHERSASFGHERRAKLGDAGMAVLRERWPDYERDVGATLFSFERRVLDWRVRRIFASAVTHEPRMRVLVAGDSADHREEWRLVMHDERVDLWRGEHIVVSHASDHSGANADPTSLDDRLSCWLQAHAFDAIVAVGKYPVELRDVAECVGIPFAEIASGEDIHRCAERAIASARTFKDGSR
jgi:GT2 family glycosyltransferase